MKHYHALIVFALLVMPSVFFSWQNVQAVKREISMDMSQALAKALDEQETFEITPDTIQNYCQHHANQNCPRGLSDRFPFRNICNIKVIPEKIKVSKMKM